MFRYILMLFSILIAVPIQAEDSLDLRKLFINSIGGETALDSLKEVKDVSIEGTVKLNQIEGKFISYFSMPDHFYMKLDFPMFSMVQAYDGQTMWMEDMNGQITEVSGAEKDEAIKNLYFETYSYLFEDRYPGSYKYKGDTTINDTGYYLVEFYPFFQDTIVTLFNKSTSMPEYKISALENQVSISTAADFRKVNSIFLPHYSKAENPAAGSVLEFITDTIQINSNIEKNIFSPATDDLIDYIFPDGKDSVTIPFIFDAGHIYITAKINHSKKVTFLLDSGASKNIFHSKTFDSLKLPVVGTMTAMGVSGYNEVDLVKTDSINIGGLLLLNQIAGSMDISQVLPKFDEMGDFGGILGFDFLSRFPLKVDFQNNLLTVYNPVDFVIDSSGVIIPFEYTMNIPTISCQLNGVEGRYIVDLGNAFGLVLFPDYLENNNMMEMFSDIKENSSLLSGVGGSIPGKNAFVEKFNLGNKIMLEDLRVMIPASSQGLTGFKKMAGNIGNLVLNNFDLVFDYNNEQIILYPVKNNMGQ